MQFSRSDGKNQTPSGLATKSAADVAHQLETDIRVRIVTEIDPTKI